MQQEAEIVAFLRANPGFLAGHAGLYDVLDPPARVHGPPLADHMEAMLRQARMRAAETEQAATQAAADRRGAEGFLRRVHDAVLAMMRAPDPAFVALHDLAGLLQLDAARLCIEAPHPPPGAAPVPRGTVAAALGQRLSLVRAARPDALLHGEAVALAEQEALVRVPLGSAPALLALASRGRQGLLGATTHALSFLGHAVAAAMERR